MRFVIDAAWEDPVLCVAREDWALDAHRAATCHPSSRAARVAAGCVVVSWTPDGYYELHPRAGGDPTLRATRFDVAAFLPAAMHASAGITSSIDMRIVLPPKPGAPDGDVSAVDDTYGRARFEDVPFFARLHRTWDFVEEIKPEDRSAWNAADACAMLRVEGGRFAIARDRLAALGSKTRAAGGTTTTLRFGFAYDYSNGVSFLVPIYVVEGEASAAATLPVRVVVLHSMNRLISVGAICGATAIGEHVGTRTLLAASAMHCIDDAASALLLVTSGYDARAGDPPFSLARVDLAALRASFMDPSALVMPKRSNGTLRDAFGVSSLTFAPFALNHSIPGSRSFPIAGITALTAAVPYDRDHGLQNDFCLLEYARPDPSIALAAITEDALAWGEWDGPAGKLRAYICGGGVNRFGDSSARSAFVHSVRAWVGGPCNGFLRESSAAATSLASRHFLHPFGPQVASYDPTHRANTFGVIFHAGWERTGAAAPPRVAYYADTCQGDSGGPLFATINSVPTLLAVTSHGYNCGTMPGAMTSVACFASAIARRFSDYGVRLVTFDALRDRSDAPPPAFAMDAIEHAPGELRLRFAAEAMAGLRASDARDTIRLALAGGVRVLEVATAPHAPLSATRDGDDAILLSKNAGRAWPLGMDWVATVRVGGGTLTRVTVEGPGWIAPCRVIDPRAVLRIDDAGMLLAREGEGGGTIACKRLHVLGFVPDGVSTVPTREPGARIVITPSPEVEGSLATPSWSGTLVHWQAEPGKSRVSTTTASALASRLLGTLLRDDDVAGGFLLDYRVRSSVAAAWDDGSGLVRWTTRVVAPMPTVVHEATGSKPYGAIRWELDAGATFSRDTAHAHATAALLGRRNVTSPHGMGVRPAVVIAGRSVVLLYTGGDSMSASSVALHGLHLRAEAAHDAIQVEVKHSKIEFKFSDSSWAEPPCFSWIVLGRLLSRDAPTLATRDALVVDLVHIDVHAATPVYLVDQKLVAPRSHAELHVPHFVVVEGGAFTVVPEHVSGPLTSSVLPRASGSEDKTFGGARALAHNTGIAVAIEGGVPVFAMPIVSLPREGRGEDAFAEEDPIFVAIVEDAVFARGSGGAAARMRVWTEEGGVEEFLVQPSTTWRVARTLPAPPLWWEVDADACVQVLRAPSGSPTLAQARGVLVPEGGAGVGGVPLELVPCARVWARGEHPRFFRVGTHVIHAFEIGPLGEFRAAHAVRHCDALVARSASLLRCSCASGFAIGSWVAPKDGSHYLPRPPDDVGLPPCAVVDVAERRGSVVGSVVVLGDAGEVVSLPFDVAPLDAHVLFDTTSDEGGPVLEIISHLVGELSDARANNLCGSVWESGADVGGVPLALVAFDRADPIQFPELAIDDEGVVTSPALRLGRTPDGAVVRGSALALRPGMDLFLEDGTKIPNVRGKREIDAFEVDDASFVVVAPRGLLLAPGIRCVRTSRDPRQRTMRDDARATFFVAVPRPTRAVVPTSPSTDVSFEDNKIVVVGDVDVIAIRENETVRVVQGLQKIAAGAGRPVRVLLSDGRWVQADPTREEIATIAPFSPPLHGVRLRIRAGRAATLANPLPALTGIDVVEGDKLALHITEDAWEVRRAEVDTTIDLFDPSARARVEAVRELEVFSPNDMLTFAIAAAPAAVRASTSSLVRVKINKTSYLHGLRAMPEVLALQDISAFAGAQGSIVVPGIIALAPQTDAILGFTSERMAPRDTIAFDVREASAAAGGGNASVRVE